MGQQENDKALPELEIVTANDGVIWVGGSTPTKKLASCIFASATKEQRAEVKLRGIGAGANNQMTKAYIIAKGKLIEKGITATVDMSFKDVKGKEAETGATEPETITALEFTITFKQ